jgi:thiol:disulfide interchange protein DsbC
MIRRMAALSMLLAAVFQADAAGDVPAPVRARLAELFPGEAITTIAPAAVAGVYEVLVGASVFYVTADGRYALRGDIIDLEKRTNLSAERRRGARKQVFEGLAREDYIEFGANGSKQLETLYVFTDIDCGYCRRFHREVKQLNAAGITVRYLAFPRTGTQGESFDKAVAVWCSDDRQAAMTAAKSGGKVAANACPNPVAAQFELGQAVGVTGTPAVYTGAGEQIGGYVPATELIKMLQEGKI